VNGADGEDLAADPLSDQIRWFFDTRLGVDEDEAVPESPMQKYRDGFELVSLGDRHDVGATGDFGSVELLISKESPMPGGWVHVVKYGEFDARWLHLISDQWLHELVVATRDG
jgi:hypothetical protein